MVVVVTRRGSETEFTPASVPLLMFFASICDDSTAPCVSMAGSECWMRSEFSSTCPGIKANFCSSTCFLEKTPNNVNIKIAANKRPNRINKKATGFEFGEGVIIFTSGL